MPRSSASPASDALSADEQRCHQATHQEQDRERSDADCIRIGHRQFDMTYNARAGLQLSGLLATTVGVRVAPTPNAFASETLSGLVTKRSL
jgi:hypothetical protein